MGTPESRVAPHTIFGLPRRCDVSTATTGVQEHLQHRQAIFVANMAQSTVDWRLVDSVWPTPQNVNDVLLLIHATSFVILDHVPAYLPIYQLVMLLVSNGVPQVVPVYVEVFQSSMLMQ